MKSTKKHVAKTTLKPAEKPVMAVATDDESDEEEDLATLTKLQLVDLAESLKINTTGNKADLLKRINEKRGSNAEAEDDHEKRPSGISGGKIVVAEVKDGWKEAVLQRVAKLNIDQVQLDWSAARALLTPAVWPVILYRTPIDRNQMRGLLGTEGELLLAFQKRWKSLLQCTDEENEALKVSMSMDKSDTVESWCRVNWSIHVAPVIKMVRLLQASNMRRHGNTTASNRLKFLANIPSEMLGYDVLDLVEKAAGTKSRRAESEDSSENSSRRTGRRNKYVKGQCRRCGRKAETK